MPPHIGAKRYFKLTVTTVNGQTLDAFWTITATDPENCDKQRPRSLTSELNDSPVYPNPISQFCSLQLKPSVENEPGYLQIVDINGKEVGALEVFAPDHGLLQIDLGNISSGLYVLRVTTPTRMASYKVIKN